MLILIYPQTLEKPSIARQVQWYTHPCIHTHTHATAQIGRSEDSFVELLLCFPGFRSSGCRLLGLLCLLSGPFPGFKGCLKNYFLILCEQTSPLIHCGSAWLSLPMFLSIKSQVSQEDRKHRTEQDKQPLVCAFQLWSQMAAFSLHSQLTRFRGPSHG